MEALMRLAYRVMHLWPALQTASSSPLKPSNSSSPVQMVKRDSINSIGSDELNNLEQGEEENIDNDNNSIGDESVSSSSVLSKKEKEEKASGGGGDKLFPSPKEHVLKGDELNPLLASAHKTLRGITELLLMALRDRDTPGMRYLFQERKRKETELAARLQRQHQAALTAGSELPPELDEMETTRQALALLEQITGQALHMQRASNKSSGLDGAAHGEE
jgi:hypothetical protein